MLNKEKENIILDTVNNFSKGATHEPPAGDTSVTRRTAETPLIGVRGVL